MNIKNEKGITLIALAITVVVMAILAAVVISETVEDNGLITQAEEGIIKASIREVEDALDTYMLLKEREKIKEGDYTAVKIEDFSKGVAIDEENILFSEADTSQTGYKIFAIINLEKLNIKGDYGQGVSRDVFKVKVKESDQTYEVFYVGYDDTIYYN